MTREQFRETPFEDLIITIDEMGDMLVSYDSIKAIIISAVDNDDFSLASHLTMALYNKPLVDNYWYSISAGVYDTPIPIENKEDLERMYEETFGFDEE